ncbi:hypothetical protein MLD52_20760 [Puniceicoccaceae bacterium K14]|nr:hypothetical protein [Puniceicoccaceae bacterium K14]
MSEVIDIVIFATPIFFVLRRLFKKKTDLRTIVIKRFERNRDIGRRGTMKEGLWYFFIVALLAAYAYFRAGLPYLWLGVSIIFGLMGLIMLFVLTFQHITKQEVPEFPDTITEEGIERGVEKERRERFRTRIIWCAVIAVWIYSWRSIIRM